MGLDEGEIYSDKKVKGQDWPTRCRSLGMLGVELNNMKPEHLPIPL